MARASTDLEEAGERSAAKPREHPPGGGREWDGDDLVHERVHDDDGTVTSPVTTWVFEPGMFTPLAKLEGRTRFGIVTDHLGTPAILTTEAGAIAWRAQLDVYGVVLEEEGVARDEDRTANPWRFPGQYEDAETGLYYNRFRYYDPELGRYLSEDPIGLRGGEAQYGYVTDPLSWLDPLGLAQCRRTKHVDNRHINRAKYPARSKFRVPNQIDKLVDRVLASPDRVFEQGRRLRLEKVFDRVVGTRGERTVVVVIDQAKRKIITTFPTL